MWLWRTWRASKCSSAVLAAVAVPLKCKWDQQHTILPHPATLQLNTLAPPPPPPAVLLWRTLSACLLHPALRLGAAQSCISASDAGAPVCKDARRPAQSLGCVLPSFFSPFRGTLSLLTCIVFVRHRFARRGRRCYCLECFAALRVQPRHNLRWVCKRSVCLVTGRRLIHLATLLRLVSAVRSLPCVLCFCAT